MKTKKILLFLLILFSQSNKIFATDLDWSPPDNPDPGVILDLARADVAEKKYKTVF